MKKRELPRWAEWVISVADSFAQAAVGWVFIVAPLTLFLHGSWGTFFLLWIALSALWCPLVLLEHGGGPAPRVPGVPRQPEAERIAEGSRWREAEKLRREQEAQAKQKEAQARLNEAQAEAQAYREEVERFRRDRLSIERFVVGDEQAGIRSPYEVEMTDAEKALLDTISSKFDPSCLLVDTYLDKGDGTTTQVDIIAICRQGVIVIESKGLGGTMSGKWDDKEWVQQPSQRRIYNPIRQNDLHVESIRQVLDRVLEPTETREDPDEIPF